MEPAGNNLDPSAEEFHPSQYPLLPPPPVFYAYGAPPPVPTIFQAPQLNPSPYVSPATALPDTKPTRTLLLSSVPPHATEGAVRAELESFGGVRAVEMGRVLSEGLVTVHFYDLRSAQAALAEIREQHVRQQSLLSQQYGFMGMVPGGAANWVGGGGRGLIAGRAVWAQYAPEAAGLDGPNNGSLVVFNLDSEISSAALKDVFETFGAVKELRETPLKPRHRFVEFFDIRDAGRALHELSGKEIFGKRVVIEFSRPGGQQARRKGPSYQPAVLPPRLLPHPRADATIPRPAALLARAGGECSVSPNEKDGESSRRNKKAAPSTTARHKTWKTQAGKSKTSNEARYLFKETFIAAGSSSSSSLLKDSRTTVMIKNIPNKYSLKLLLNMLDNHCIHYNERIAAEGDGTEPMSSYDFVYLPIDFNNKCNVGYGFVNMTSPEATWRLYRAFHLQPWEVFNSRKICHVTYARLQGLEALKEHFKNSKFACDTDEYMPAFFSPPRDGKTLTTPSPIGSRGGAAMLTSSGSKKMAELMEEMGAPPSDDPSTDEDTVCDGGGDATELTRAFHYHQL